MHDCIPKLAELASISLSSNLLSFNNVVDALIACFETVDGNHIIKYTAQNQIVLATTVVAGSGTTMIKSYTSVNKNCDLPPSACIDLSLNSIVVSMVMQTQESYNILTTLQGFP